MYALIKNNEVIRTKSGSKPFVIIEDGVKSTIPVTNKNVLPYREIPYDKETYKSVGKTVDITETEVVATHTLEPYSQEVRDERNRVTSLHKAETDLLASDTDMARVGEDFFQLFKDFIVQYNMDNPEKQFTQTLPDIAADKITNRQSLRSQIRTLAGE